MNVGRPKRSNRRECGNPEVSNIKELLLPLDLERERENMFILPYGIKGH
jgi:hypothetical protein